MVRVQRRPRRQTTVITGERAYCRRHRAVLGGLFVVPNHSSSYGMSSRRRRKRRGRLEVVNAINYERTGS